MKLVCTERQGPTVVIDLLSLMVKSRYSERKGGFGTKTVATVEQFLVLSTSHSG